MKPSNTLAALLLVACNDPAAEALRSAPSSTSSPAPAAGEAGAAEQPLQCADAAQVPRAVFVPKCGAAGCHAPPSAAANLDLVSPNVADRLVGVKDSKGAFLLIDAADPEESLIYERVVGAASPRMPLDAPLDEATTA